MNKKGVELSLQTVIIGVILLIVLVVVIFIFLRFTGETSEGLNQTLDNVNPCIDDPGSEDCKLLDDLRNNDNGIMIIPPVFFRRKR